MPVDFTIEDQVAWVTLNRPERMNAVDTAAEASLRTIWSTIRDDSSLRCVVITGVGRAFCAGADMKEEGPGGLAYWAATGDQGFAGIALGGALPIPVLAKVNGLALGGGFEIVLGCDLVIAAESAAFGLPEARVGRMPLDGMAILPKRLPRALAMGLLLTGRRISAHEAATFGLVNEVVPDADLDATVAAWVADIVACAPLSIRAIKRCVTAGSQLSEHEARNLRTSELVAALNSADADEGVRAFREKRAPEWQGR